VLLSPAAKMAAITCVVIRLMFNFIRVLLYNLKKNSAMYYWSCIIYLAIGMPSIFYQ
jgi:hypothetical protein